MNDAVFYKEMYRRECAETERLRAALKDIKAKAVGDPPRHTWYYDRAEEALAAVPSS